MLYETHAIAAARGFVRMQMPGVFQVVRAYEALTGRTFPKLKPHALWYRQPVYYMGNHLTFATDGEDIVMPSYTRRSTTSWSSASCWRNRCVMPRRRRRKRRSAASWCSTISLRATCSLPRWPPVSGRRSRSTSAARCPRSWSPPTKILPRWHDLNGFVKLNGATVAEPSTAGAKWSLGEVLAHASRSEQLHPGELFGSGTLPNGSGIETGHALKPGDRIEIGIENIGTLANPIV